jgi:hypothetical protein
MRAMKLSRIPTLVKLSRGILSPTTPTFWTTIGSCSYHRLFLPSEVELDKLDEEAENAGPGAIGEKEAEEAATTEPVIAGKLRSGQKLSFKFAPDFTMLVNPDPSVIVRSLSLIVLFCLLWGSF